MFSISTVFFKPNIVRLNNDIVLNRACVLHNVSICNK